MNHHTRSFSAQQPSSQVNTGAVAPRQSESYEREWSNSQQSLDQLFNPPKNAAKPLRERKLPKSFFIQSYGEDEPATGTPANGASTTANQPNNYHARSISFDQRARAYPMRSNLHMRTQSTLAPMSQVLSNNSSHHTSQDVLNDTHSAINNNHANMACNHHNQDHNHPQHQQAAHHCSNGHIAGTVWQPGTINGTDSSRPMLNNWVSEQAQSPTIAMSNQQSVISPQHQQAGVVHQQTSYQIANGISSTQQQTSTNNRSFVVSDQASRPMNGMQHVCSTNMHSRSMSYGHQSISGPRGANNGNMHHMRTHSIVAPMQATPIGPVSQPISTVGSRPSSHQSSHEFLSHNNSMNYSSANGWSSSGYSTDDLNNGWSSGTAATNSQTTFTPQAATNVVQQQVVQTPATMIVHSQPQQTVINQDNQQMHNHHHGLHDHHHHHHSVHLHHHHDHVPIQHVVESQSHHHQGAAAAPQHVFYNA